MAPDRQVVDPAPNAQADHTARGSAGYTAQECYQKAFEQGWQGLMVWTSNGVDGNGSKLDSKPGTDWIYNNYPHLVEGVAAIKDENTSELNVE